MIENHEHDLSDSTAAPPRSRSRPVLATVLAALFVLAVAGGVGMGIWLRNDSQDRDDAQQSRVAAVQAAREFTEVWNTFTPEDAQGYVERVSPLLSTKFRTEFTSASADVVSGIQQQKLSSTGTVLADADGVPLVAVASIDNDSAEVLVVSDAERVSSGQNVVRHWRWQVHLVKVDGEWLVDGFDEA